jgi:hypothetical protein
VESEHDLIGQLVDVIDDILGGSKIELEFAFHLIAHIVSVSVPAPARIGEVGHFAEIDIEVRFADDAQGAVIVLLPEVAVILF